MLDMLEDLRNIDRLARRAVHQHRGLTLIGDIREAFEVSRSAIMELLAERWSAGEECSEYELVGAGFKAVSALTHDVERDRSLRSKIYWLPLLVVPSCEERVIDKHALAEVLSRMSDRDRELLITFAAHDDVKSAAKHLGITPEHMKVEIRKARHRFFELWFDWEESPKVPPLTRSKKPLAGTCRRGHEFTPENTGYHRGATSRARTYRYCMACSRMHDARRAERTANSSTKDAS